MLDWFFKSYAFDNNIIPPLLQQKLAQE